MEEGSSRRQPEQAGKAKPAGKGKEKSAKKTTRAQEPAEEEPVVHKPIKITVRRPEPKPADFVQKIRLGTNTEEEAKDEDSAKPLERHAPTRGQEQRAEEPAPPVGGTQQQAKGPTPITEKVGEHEESRAAQKEAAPEQMLPDDGVALLRACVENEAGPPGSWTEE